MFADVALTCSRCDAELTARDRRLTMRTSAGHRHAYECACGAVTITVSN